LKAAVDLFGERGLDGVSLREVAERAGVNQALISYHFGGKEGLFFACIEDFNLGRIETLKGVLTEPQSAEDLKLRLKIFLENVVHQCASDCRVARIILRELQTRRDNPEFFKRMLDTVSPLHKLLTEFLDRAKGKGLLKEDLDTEMAGTILLGILVHPHISEQMIRIKFGYGIEDPRFTEAYARTALSIILQGIAK
ncbi:MAG: TetR family transcriptional regulator, partial [Bdellovibrionaceae bacterium]|nr:TetR family transcriptional regulator [Pseudobdellovibrionaceae bacterium]